MAMTHHKDDDEYEGPTLEDLKDLYANDELEPAAPPARTNTIQPRTIHEAMLQADALGLEPYISDNNRWTGFTCPICRSLGRKAQATVEKNPLGFLQVTCAGCHDNIEPGILAVLGAINPNGNVIPLHPEQNGHATPTTRNLGTQTWRAFEETAGEDVPCIIQGLWPEGALGFIGAAPKAGKTWLGLDIAISVATGTPVFGAFPVATSHPVLYVALEGHKAAVRTRIGCLSRGHGIHPEDQGLDNLHLAYKPKGINLHDPGWAKALCDEATDLRTRFVIVDVLRRAAQIKENDASSFMELIDLLNPISEASIALGMLHHFNKVNEMTSTRTPAERMAGSGAMFGALDVGLFITKSEAGARKLEIHTDIRDLAAPPRFQITLQGEPTGPHGGFTYHDNLRLILEDVPEKETKGSAHSIKAFILTKEDRVYPREILDHFDISDTLLRRRRDELETLGIIYIKDGKNSGYEALTPNTPNNPKPREGLGSPDPPQTPNLLRRGSGSLGSSADPSPDRPAKGLGSAVGAEVPLDSDDDAGYWAMLNAITDPEAKEHE